MTSCTCSTRRKLKLCSCFQIAMKTTRWESIDLGWLCRSHERCRSHDVLLCQEFCSQYWFDEKKTFGEMEVEIKETENTPTYVRRCLEIQHTKVRIFSSPILIQMITYQYRGSVIVCVYLYDIIKHSDLPISPAEERQPHSAAVPLPEMGGASASRKPSWLGRHDEDFQTEQWQQQNHHFTHFSTLQVSLYLILRLADGWRMLLDPY